MDSKSYYELLPVHSMRILEIEFTLLLKNYTPLKCMNPYKKTVFSAQPPCLAGHFNRIHTN